MYWFSDVIFLILGQYLIEGSPATHINNEALLHAKRNGLDIAKYDSFVITELLEFSNGKIKLFDHNSRRRGVDDKTILHVPVQDDTYIIHLSHQKPVLHPEAPIVLTDGDSKQTVDVSTPNCYLVGNEQCHGGSASLSYCHGLRGTFNTKHTEIVLLPIEGQQRHLVATRKLKRNEFDSYKVEEDLVEEPQDMKSVTNPVSKSGKAVIEIGVYIDADYYTLMEERGENTLAKKIDVILVKWNAVQYEYFKKEQLGRVVEIQLKKMEFFKTNPKWLIVTDKLGPLLHSLCKWNKDKEPFDTIYLHTGHRPMKPVGLAYVGGVCKSNQRCAVSVDTDWGSYAATAHELGHNLFMKHDTDTSCKNYPKAELGLMGGHGTNFSVCSVASFKKMIKENKGQCLFVENVKIVQPNLKGKTLSGLLPQMYHTFDDMCKHRAGADYRYRENSFNTKYSCIGLHYCVNTKPGAAYGHMKRMSSKSQGQYCADGKACHQGRCVRYKDFNLHVPLHVRKGHWGHWGPYSKCSRTCGTGVTVSQRRCDSPIPMNTKDCPGEEYHARLCNTKPCPRDPKSATQIAAVRATEVCTKLVKNGILPASEYNKQGRVYVQKDILMGCEAQCNQSNGKERKRNALLPDGTPCITPNTAYRIPAHINNVHNYCLKGTCQPFDCLSTFPPAVYGKDKRCPDGGIVGW